MRKPNFNSRSTDNFDNTPTPRLASISRFIASMEGTCARLREKEDIKEFYLGMKDAGVRGERRWKKKKTWR